MVRPAVLLKRTLIFVHRWIGVTLSVIFLLWFASGIVMMYWSFPGVTAEQRLERLPVLNPDQIKVAPTAARAALGTDAPAGQPRLTSFDNRPAYRFGGRGGNAMVYADTGTVVDLVDEAMVGRAAVEWARRPLTDARKSTVEEVDQWTVGMRNALPLQKYSFADGQQVYIDGDTAEVRQYTTTSSRFWAWLGAIPHWLYFTPLRKHQPEWFKFVVWSSLIGTITALIGVVIAIWMLSPSKRYRYAGTPTSIPYRGWKRWHTIIGLCFGVITLTWAFSGLLSMGPFPITDKLTELTVPAPPATEDGAAGRGGRGGQRRGPNLAAALRGRVNGELSAYEEKDPRTAIASVRDFGVKELELTSFAGEPIYLATNGNGETRLVPVRGPPKASFDIEDVMRIVRNAAGESLADLRVMDSYDAYYLDRLGESPLPVVYAEMNDPARTRYYIDPKTARIVGNYSARNWVSRWLYHGLHSLDFPWLYNYRPLWDIVVITLMLGGTAICVTSLVLTWRVLARKLNALVRAHFKTPDEDPFMNSRGGVMSAFRFAWTLVLTFVMASAAFAQQLSLSGTVRDTTGAIPGATVTLASAGAQVATTTTDESGKYRFTGLAAGSYELTVTMRGFEPATRNVALGPDTSAVDVVLAVGRVNTSVSVTATAGKATATRLPVPDVDVPAQVSTIPQELILQQGSNTIADALRNASGVQAIRWYGVYEQYTVRGFFDADRDGFNAVMIDGMRRNGNRYATQANNVEAIEVLKGPSSILYGRGALGGSINIIRKKPQAVRSGDVFYRGGRFNTHQVALGTTGPVGNSDRLMYRTDLSFEASDGWRDAGADRLNVAPSLTWLISPKARLTLHQVFARDRFDGDGGVPLNIITLPAFRRDLNFGLPQDRVLIEDSQTHALFTGTLARGWELRNSLSVQRTSDKYFVTEGVYGDPDANEVFREPLDFHHIRRPIQNQTEVVGRVSGAGTHNLLFGYEYHRDKYRTEVTAGDDPDCICGYWWLTIAPMDITTMAETQGPLDIDTIARTTYVNDRTQAFYAQDQIDITPLVKVNLGYRMDNYDRDITRVGGFPFTPVQREQTAHSYRAGIVLASRSDQQFYFATSSSFTPVNTVPADGSQLEPSTARNYEVGHRWQGWNGRVDTTAAFYYLTRNNVTIQQSVLNFIQVGEQISKGVDVDVNTDLGGDAFLVFNYGLTLPKFDDPGNPLDGKTPRFAPKHNVNVWLRKDFRGGLNAGFGLRYLAAQFGNNSNTEVLDDYTIFSGAIGYRTPGWDWTVNAENLFNNDNYFLPGHFGNNAFPGQPINVTTTVRLKWR